MYISEISFRDIMNLIRDITNLIHDITKSIRDMYISRIQITHIANSGLNSKTAFHKAARNAFFNADWRGGAYVYVTTVLVTDWLVC